MSSRTSKLPVEWKYSDDVKRVYASHTWAMVMDNDARIVFGLVGPAMQSEAAFMPKGEGKYEIEIILPLRTLKELAIGLNNAVKDAESRFGEIKLPQP
jgi:hypothetical protein